LFEGEVGHYSMVRNRSGPLKRTLRGPYGVMDWSIPGDGGDSYAPSGADCYAAIGSTRLVPWAIVFRP
jgi:hypothetical protein